MYDFLIDLINERTDVIKATKEQTEMIKKINELGSFVLLEEESIKKEKSRGAIKKAKTKTQTREIISLQRSVINNAIKLHDKRKIIIDAFMNKNILPGNLEEDVYYRDEEPKFDESIAERTKMRRQNQKARELKMLSPQQMLSRSPISLAQLKARNNSEKLKNEIRQLLYSLYR